MGDDFPQIFPMSSQVLRIMESGGFRLPTTPLLPNDMSLTIQAIGPGRPGRPPGDNEDFWEKWDPKKDEPSEKKVRNMYVA
jgi:hypothetical protein